MQASFYMGFWSFFPARTSSSLDSKAALLISFAVCTDNMADERCFLKSCNSPPDEGKPSNNNRSPQLIDTLLIKEHEW